LIEIYSINNGSRIYGFVPATPYHQVTAVHTMLPADTTDYLQA
jgi:hypothetical protein